jgi:hypothetical protein
MEFRAHVARRLRRRDWKIFLAIKARKIRPKMIEAATMTPTTTLGRPDFADELLASLAFVLPVLVAALTVLNDVRVLTFGGGVVTTCALVRGVVDVVLVVVRGVVDGTTGVGADGVTTPGRVVGVAVVRVDVEVVVGSGPKISESRDSKGSTVVASSVGRPLCRGRSSCTSRRSSSRATRAISLLGGKCIARIAV